ncbi:MAG: hypothetical protein KGI41_02360 [Patescibacteria group bacterium]|nr:hypothetical protein [Patescibacteria group bacterium]MDE1966057.1 hypothetical protein [Patescibacteria group bacterium]
MTAVSKDGVLWALGIAYQKKKLDESSEEFTRFLAQLCVEGGRLEDVACVMVNPHEYPDARFVCCSYEASTGFTPILQLDGGMERVG